MQVPARCRVSYLRFAGNEKMKKNMETIIMGLGFRRNGTDNEIYYNGFRVQREWKIEATMVEYTSKRIHSFLAGLPNPKP